MSGFVWVVVRAGYAMVAARAALAVLFRNRSWWWVAYAIVLVVIEPLAAAIEESASGGWK